MVLNFAHRGFSEKYPENTLLAFQKAVEAGCDGIELDVQLSKDGEIVIFHDEEIGRVTGQKGFVWDYTVKELKQMDASFCWKKTEKEKKGGSTDKEREQNQGISDEILEIPTLREYFETIYPSGIITNIELKTSWNTYPGIEEKVLQMIDEFDLREKIWISSFNHYSAVKFKKLAPDIKCGLLEESRVVGMAEYAARLGMDFLHPVYYTVTTEYVREAGHYGLGINTWTVNEKEELQRLERMGIHAVIGNDPAMIRSWQQRAGLV